MIVQLVFQKRINLPLAVILGHSFVRSLSDHYLNNFKGSYMPLDIAKALLVNDNVSGVHLYGISGALAVSFPYPTEWLDKLAPQILLLELGSNDLARDIDVELVARSLLDAATWLHQCYHAIVGVLSVVPRFEGLQSSPSVFRLNLNRLETILKMAISGSPFLFFHKHKGFKSYT